MPVAPYGTTNPRGLEPWQIESTLAPLAVGGSQAEAQNMLNMYQKQREAAGNVYGEDLAAQHQYAYDALAQQMAEARMKEVPNLLNAPGGAHLLGPGGLPGMSMGTDPTVMQGVISAADAAQQAKQFEAGGKGYEGYSNAGVTIPIGALPGLPPGTQATQTENVRLGVERLRDATMLGVAGIHARSAGANVGRATAQVGPNDATGNVPMTLTAAKGESPEAFVTRLKQQGYTPTRVQLPGPDGTDTSDGTPTAPAAPTPNRVPGLAANAPASAPAGTRVQGASPGADPIQKAVRDHVENNVRVQNPAAYKDIMAGAAANGNQIQLLKDPNGRVIGVKGAQGTYK